MYLRVGEHGVRIMHEEHSPITLTAGTYVVVRQVCVDAALVASAKKRLEEAVDCRD